MSENTPPENGSPKAKTRPLVNPVIRKDPRDAAQIEPVRWLTIGFAVLVSLGFDLLLISVMLVVPFRGAAADAQQKDTTVIDTQVDEPQANDHLTNDDFGDDPTIPENTTAERIEKVTVPVPVQKDQALGMPGAKDGPMMTVPSPPGLVDLGNAGGLDSDIKGHANLGPAGGLNLRLAQPGGFGNRFSGATRAQAVKEGGGTTASEAAVGRGLIWLAHHQAPDGHWSLDNFRVYGQCNCGNPGQSQDIAATAFGVLPFLGAGETHKTPPNSHGSGMYRKNVEKALKYLVLKQDGRGDFSSGPAEMYAHGLATMAICEAYGMTSDPRLKGPAQRALTFIVRAQSPQGGWSYNAPCVGHDTSVGGWQLMALKSGQMAGLEVPNKTIEMAKKWLDDVADPDGSRYGYQSRGATPTMSAVGLLCREYIQWGPRNPSLRKGVNYLLQSDNLPGSMRNMYYYYYATQVMHHFGGAAWQKWNPMMRDLLVRTQDLGRSPKHEHQRGSWDPVGDAFAPQGGRLMMTSLSILTLEVYYRHLPLYRREMGGAKK